MNSIAEKKTETHLADRVREVKSKVFGDFRPPIFRKPARIETPEPEKFARSNSTMSGVNKNSGAIPKSFPSRSNSTMSSTASTSIGGVSRLAYFLYV
jgi:hypothetical protein